MPPPPTTGVADSGQQQPSTDTLMTTPTTNTSESINLTCHCGLVTVEIPCLPKGINECRCTVCYSYGALWGYFLRGDVMVTTAAVADGGVGGVSSQQSYVRTDEGADGDLGFYRCGRCGTLTHWWGERDTERRLRLGPKAKMGVNMRLLGEKGVQGIESSVSHC